MIPTISLAMIVRDGEEDLASCLQSVIGEVDEIVIVDTGSQDRTVSIASRFTNKIYFYKWKDDFSAARNFAISKCSGQWIFSLDADEKLDSQSGSLRQLITDNPGAEAFLLPLLFCVGATDERFSVVRLFLNTAEYRFVGKIHEQVVITKSNVVGVGDVPVIRHKLITGRERNIKRRRNLEMLRQAVSSDPGNGYLKYYLGVEWLGFRKFELALTCFQEAAAIIRPEYLMFRGMVVRYLVDCLKFLGRLEDAFKVCCNECEINPVYTDIFFEAGAILEEQGQFKQAIGYFHKAIELALPPLVLYHFQGTESFLAFYHLGFCYEKIGRYELAEQYYWQALVNNSRYVRPLYSLFLLKIANLPAPDVYDYFKSKQSFVFDPWVETLATAFFDWGFPDLAVACYEQSLSLGADTDGKRIKSLLYSGRIQETLQILSKNGKDSPDTVTESVIAYLVSGNGDIAKQQALELWGHLPEQRSKAWALLAIIARSNSTGGYIKPEKSRELEVVQIWLAILEDCLRFNSKASDMNATTNQVFQKLVNILVSMLMELSADSNLRLAEFFWRKGRNIRCLLDYKYASARGLYV